MYMWKIKVINRAMLKKIVLDLVDITFKDARLALCDSMHLVKD